MSLLKAVIEDVEDLSPDTIVSGKYAATVLEHRDQTSRESTIFTFKRERLGDVLKKVEERGREHGDKIVIERVY
ncbi:hypothetical protein ACFL2R_03585 [Patescibacteria group bacterium]